MTPEEKKANELIEGFLNQPIRFPYVDSEDGHCLGSGYMLYNSAVECAILTVKEIIKFQDIMLEEFPSIGYEPVFYKIVLELLRDKLR
jgi:hypothetical protein